MIEALMQAANIGQDAMWDGFVTFLRVAGMAALLPAFGEQSVPARVKLVMALAFAAIVTPAAPTVPLPENAPLLAGLVLAEIVTGLFFGLMLRLFVMGLQVAGTIAAQSTSLSQLLGGAGMDPLPAMGHVLVLGGLALVTILGLHVKIVEYILLSYMLVPIGDMIPSDVMSRSGVATVSRAFALGFTLAAPFVIASLIYNVTLGVINKAMPQLMVAFVGAPAITAGGLFLLALCAPLLLSLWAQALDHFMMDPFGPPR